MAGVDVTAIQFSSQISVQMVPYARVCLNHNVVRSFVHSPFLAFVGSFLFSLVYSFIFVQSFSCKVFFSTFALTTTVSNEICSF